jgi:thioredoxin reductase (NADPH)
LGNEFEIIIIGSGPIGLACGIEAKRNGLSYLIMEAGVLCNSIFHYPVNMTFFSTSPRLEIGDVPFVSHGDKPTRREALEYYRRVKEHWNLNVKLYEPVDSIIKFDEKYEITSNKNKYHAKFVIIATGFYGKPNMMNIPGESLPKVKHYYDDPHSYIDQKVIIVGGGNSAVDAALETYRKGAEVTMVIKKEKLDEGVKYWVRPDIENRIKEGSIKAYFNSTVKTVKETEVEIQTPEENLVIQNNFVLAMTGYHPDYKFLKRAGIEFTDDETREPFYNKNNFETNMKNIFVAGVVCGGMNTGKLFIENSRSHAKDIVEFIIKKNSDKNI